MKIAVYSTDVLCDGLAGIWPLDEFGHPNGPRIGREPGTVLVAFSDNTEKLYKVGGADRGRWRTRLQPALLPPQPALPNQGAVR